LRIETDYGANRMIDANTEHLVSLTHAGKLLPPRRGGKRPHVSCLYRWTVAGCKGIQLESLQVGGTRCTSREALARFFERLGQATGVDRDLPTVRTPGERARANARAEQELIKSGF
jgi:hypothetical protein